MYLYVDLDLILNLSIYQYVCRPREGKALLSCLQGVRILKGESRGAGTIWVHIDTYLDVHLYVSIYLYLSISAFWV